MRERFIETKFHDKVADIIARANAVIADYQSQGLTLTVRQLYYVFIGENLFPDSWIDTNYNKRHNLSPLTKNTIKNYKRLAEILNRARLAGWMDWTAIEDRTRWLRDTYPYSDPESFIHSVMSRYTEDVWIEQQNYCEVWIEKDALVGVIERPCNEYRVPYFPTRGFVSQSEAYDAGKRLQRLAATGKSIHILHLGDHDPSGLDMSRDIEERLMMFARLGDVHFNRLALNMDQVRLYDPPPNPAKETDSRYAGYAAEFGDESWELDALKPKVIMELVKTHIEALIDKPKFQEAIEKEEEGRRRLERVSENWAEVTVLLDMIEQDNNEEGA